MPKRKRKSHKNSRVRLTVRERVHAWCDGRNDCLADITARHSHECDTLTQLVQAAVRDAVIADRGRQ